MWIIDKRVVFAFVSTLLAIQLFLSQDVSAQSCTPIGSGNPTDARDYSAWSYYFTLNGTSVTGGRLEGDFNCNGVNDQQDYSIWSFYFDPFGGGGSPTPTPTISGPTPTLPPPPSTGGIWISKQEIMALPTSGSAWNNLVKAANSIPSIGCSHGEDHEVYVMAAALVAVRTNNSSMYRTVANELEKVVDNQIQNLCGGNSLSLTRTMAAYPLAADIINLKDFDPVIDNKFRNWLVKVVKTQQLSGDTQLDKYERRANNHGTQAGVVVSGAARYLGDTQLLQYSAAILKGYLGDRNSYSGFNYGDLCWQSDPKNPVGINPKGARRPSDGNNVDGVLPDDQRRQSNTCGWPPEHENYAWGGMQGAVSNAWILYRAGYDTFNWGDRALLRAVEWQYRINNYPAGGDDEHVLPIIDKIYGTNYWSGGTVGIGKLVGWTDWTHK